MSPRRPIPPGHPFVENHAHHPWFWLLVVVAVAAAAVLIVWLLVRRRPAPPAAGPYAGAYGSPPPYGAVLPRPPSDPALDHARLRYARGELSRDDYLRLVADLGGAPPTDAVGPPAGGPPAPPPPPTTTTTET